MNRQARAFLHEVLGSDWQSMPVQSGMVNTLWRVETSTRRFCFKQQPLSDYNGVNRCDDVKLQCYLAQKNLAPMPRYWNADCTFVLTDWVDAVTLADSRYASQRITRTAEILSMIHLQQPQLARWSMRCRVNNYLRVLERYDKDAAAMHRTALQPMQPLLESWDTEPGVFCHNDLSFSHILIPVNPDTTVQVVDWEYAGYGHPLFDLASAIEINRLDNVQSEALCAAYADSQRQTVLLSEVAFWRALVKLMNALWVDLQRVQTTSV